jgi:hypothetical protein
MYPETTNKTDLELLSSKALSSGVLLNTYRPATG